MNIFRHFEWHSNVTEKEENLEVIATTKQDTHQFVGQAKRCTTEIRPPNPPQVTFSDIFSNFDKCRPEVAEDFISSVAVE